MVRWGMINEDEYKMLQFADTVDQAFEYIRAGLEKYHMDADPFCRLTDPQLPTNCLVSIVYGMDQRLLHSLHYGVLQLRT